MHKVRFLVYGSATVLLAMLALPASAQSFRVQCPHGTITHPVTNTNGTNNDAENAYTVPAPLALNSSGFYAPSATSNSSTANGAIKCQQISGGDGYATMADGTQTYMFSFGPLSGLADIAAGKPGTEFPAVFDTIYTGTFQPGDPATSDGATDYSTKLVKGQVEAYVVDTNFSNFKFNGAVGLAIDYDCIQDNTGVAAAARPCPNTPTTGTYRGIDGHVDPRQIEDVGVMNGNIPAPLMAIDEDDEFFLTLTNVGMIMRPDLFEQHTVHFHGYPNASALYDGVPDASVAINIGGSFTYYYLAPDAGTYFWHCHITPPEHLQMGMVGQIYVRPRQNRVPKSETLYQALAQPAATVAQNTALTGNAPQIVNDVLRTACTPSADILCSHNLPSGGDNGTLGSFKAAAGSEGTGQLYAYNDGDGTTAYEVEYPIQIHGFDPNFHFVGMTFNPEAFEDMKDKYFLLNGRSYPDTVTPGPIATQVSTGAMHYGQPLPSIINIPAGQRALLRISDLDVTEYQTLASLGIPMHVIGYNAKLLRDQAGNNTDYYTNSITLAGGESLDVILDTSQPAPDGTQYKKGQVFYLYTPNLDHLSNDAENFGGLMTEIHIN
jgi:FtsP/CotA-like multicopper oxidase with cupredoxin domain